MGLRSRTRHVLSLSKGVLLLGYGAAMVVPFALVPLLGIGLSLAVPALALAVTLVEWARPGTLIPRKTGCWAGADGLLFEHEFVAWKDVLYAERDERYEGGSEGDYIRRVEIRLKHGRSIFLGLAKPQRFVLDVLERTGNRPPPLDTPRESDAHYREGGSRSSTIDVRIAVDGGAPVTERVVALDSLPEKEKRSVRRAIVHPGVRR